MALGTLLVANRGEVALRILRAAHNLGVPTVAVYSDADRGAPHVAAADRSVRLGPASPAESYLSTEAILRAAEETGATAVHPGYGFLAESARFAEACEARGLIFVGPQPEVIELMSRKDQARHVAVEAGAPVVPAVEGDDLRSLPTRARREIGFPALVKAVAGGGGKGMRVVRQPGELEAAVAAAGREALAAFGDGSVFVERYIPSGRHLEVQVVGDGAGRVLHLWDRDCSVQRRHQKVVEEAPASVNSQFARVRALDAAVRIATSVAYRSLGTVEFLAVGDEVYFLEMNTRLQVEHPVTEAITGIDLVELQLRLAGGEPLTLSQDDICAKGHAIEVRAYAEDAEHGFLPQAGTATYVRWPKDVRVEAALEAGQEVGTHYDPMLGKLITHGPTREAARRKMLDALDETAVFGLTNNIGFLRRLVASLPFAWAQITTSWLDEHSAELGTEDWRVPLVGAALFLSGKAKSAAKGDPFAPDGWRLGGPPAESRYALFLGGEKREVILSEKDVTIAATGTKWGLESFLLEPEGASAVIGGEKARFIVHQQPGALLVAYRGSSFRFELHGGAQTGRSVAEDVVVAPLPGTLSQVNVAPGEPVAAGQVLGVLESMKMEYPLTAPTPAKVERVGFPAGAQVARGDVLFELAALGGTPELGALGGTPEVAALGGTPKVAELGGTPEPAAPGGEPEAEAP
jgi:acetyl-CoA/propionyl-CoA carboxylase biotin carboxyl carrier protein